MSLIHTTSSVAGRMRVMTTSSPTVSVPRSGVTCKCLGSQALMLVCGSQTRPLLHCCKQARHMITRRKHAASKVFWENSTAFTFTCSVTCAHCLECCPSIPGKHTFANSLDSHRALGSARRPTERKSQQMQTSGSAPELQHLKRHRGNACAGHGPAPSAAHESAGTRCMRSSRGRSRGGTGKTPVKTLMHELGNTHAGHRPHRFPSGYALALAVAACIQPSAPLLWGLAGPTHTNMV